MALIYGGADHPVPAPDTLRLPGRALTGARSRVTFELSALMVLGPRAALEPIGDGGLGTTTVRWALCPSAALIIAILTLASILIASGAAEAHPTLLFTDPAGDSAVAQSPPMLDLSSTNRSPSAPRAVALFDASGGNCLLRP